MSDPFKSPDERARWEKIANEHADTVRRLKGDRARTRRLLDAAARRLAESPAEPEASYLQAHVRLLESFLRHVQLQDVDNEVWNVPEPATLAAIDWEALESTAALLQMGRLNMQRLATLIETDLEPALAGAPAPAGQPIAWARLRPTLAARPDWVEALKRFRMEFGAYHDVAGSTLDAFEALRAQPATPDRLAGAKAIGLPSAKGAQFRLESIFRRLPEGEAFLLAMKIDTPEPAPGDAPLEERVPPTKKRSLTDQVLGFLKKT
jgi:hypothetical protein